MRQDGVTLTNYYVFRFCSPTRSTFMTGRFPYHHGQQTEMNLNPMPGIACGINLGYSFMPAVLKRAGYKTLALGKWCARRMF
jgi:arylsulfatase B